MCVCVCRAFSHTFSMVSDPRSHPSPLSPLPPPLFPSASLPRVSPSIQWAAPYQGKNYSCATCALRPSSGPTNAWTAWINAEDEAAGVYAL